MKDVVQFERLVEGYGQPNSFTVQVLTLQVSKLLFSKGLGGMRMRGVRVGGRERSEGGREREE